MNPPPRPAAGSVSAPRSEPPPASPRGVRYGRADLRLTCWMLGLTCIWGLNAVSVKVLTQTVSPVMGATLRNTIALVMLTGVLLVRRQPLRMRTPMLGHVVLNGLLFAGEFICSYSGARLSSAGHFSVFMNTSPFVVAIGAHFVLAQDRLDRLKVLGLVGAFGGIVLLFSDGFLGPGGTLWRGDLLVFAAAVFWGTSTLHVKRFILGEVAPLQLLYAKLLVATPVMLLYSRWSEPAPLAAFDMTSLAMLAYQGAVVVFFSYLMFIVLLDRYQPSAVQSFVFLTPVWGVLSGVVVLGEPLSGYLGGGMALVGAGLYLVNRPRKPALAAHPAP